MKRPCSSIHAFFPPGSELFSRYGPRGRAQKVCSSHCIEQASAHVCDGYRSMSGAARLAVMTGRAGEPDYWVSLS